jgi:RNA polymerase sigma-70 factor (ECF subfamily)
VDGASGAPPLVARLFEQHGPAVYRFFRRSTADTRAAEDLSQEVFLRISRHAVRYEPRERERAWVFRIARNVLIDHKRAVKRVPTESGLEPVAAPTQGLQTDLQQALASLAVDDREALLLAEFGGLTYAEIASAAETSVPAIRSRIYRARLALRERLVPPPPLGRAAVPLREDDER